MTCAYRIVTGGGRAGIFGLSKIGTTHRDGVAAELGRSDNNLGTYANNAQENRGKNGQ